MHRSSTTACDFVKCTIGKPAAWQALIHLPDAERQDECLARPAAFQMGNAVSKFLDHP
jgi:hypothetical protein